MWEHVGKWEQACLGFIRGHGCLSGVPAVPGSLLDLKSMIEKVTGKPALKYYGFYGCYCGWGGHGTPKDGTDW